MTKSYRSSDKIELALRDFALGYPEAVEEFPWEHRALKVRNKVFVFLGTNDTGLFASMKLPESHPIALEFPFTEPTGYGLGRHGWVSAQFGPKDKVPVDLLRDWIDESYRAVAPKTLVKMLSDDVGTIAVTPREKSTAKQGTAKKAHKRKTAKRTVPKKPAPTRKKPASRHRKR